MNTETVTVVSLDAERSRDGTKQWWILTDSGGRKLKVWDAPVADAIRSLAASGPVEVDVKPASDPKYYPSVQAARPTAQAAVAARPDSFPQPPNMSNGSLDDALVLMDFFTDIQAAAKRAADRLQDSTIPF